MTIALAIILGASSDDSARYFATHPINTTSGDLPASTHFAPRVLGDVTFRRAVGCVIWGSASSESSIGAIDLANSDGALDVLLTKTVRDRSVTIKRGTLGTDVSSWATVATAIVDRVDFPSEDRCRIVLRDKAALLDKPVQDERYSGAANTSLNGSPKPVLIGRATNVPVVLTDPASLTYDITDSGSPAVVRVRDNGDQLTLTTHYTVSGAEITLVTAPVGIITADVRLGTTNNFDEFVEDLLITRLGLSASEVPAANLATLDAIPNDEFGRWIYDGATYAQVMDELMASFGGWWYFDRLGVLQVGRILAPTGTATHSFDPRNIALDQVRVTLDRAPGLSDTLLGRRNWRVHSTSEIAGSLTSPTYTQTAYDLQQAYVHRMVGSGTLHSTYDHAKSPAGALVPGEPATVGVGTLHAALASTALQAEATRWVGLYASQRFFCEFVGYVSDAYEIEPGDVIEVTLPRYGFDGGKKMMVVAVEGDFMSDRLTIVGWY